MSKNTELNVKSENMKYSFQVMRVPSFLLKPRAAHLPWHEEENQVDRHTMSSYHDCCNHDDSNLSLTCPDNYVDHDN